MTSQKELLNLACNYLQRSDEYENIGITWGNELKKMNTEQQIYAKKAINDILYEGQLGTLHKNSVKINEPLNTSTAFRQPTQQLERSNWSFVTTTPMLSPQSTFPQGQTEQFSNSSDSVATYFSNYSPQ